MNIKKRIENIQPYFKEMQITNVDDKQIIYVVVNFPKNWIIDEEIENKFGVVVSQGTNATEYYFCVDIDSGEDVLFDAIEYNIEKMKEAIERAQLLSLKTKELKEMFENESISIDALRTLKFSYDIPDKQGDIIISKKKQKDENKEEKKEINE